MLSKYRVMAVTIAIAVITLGLAAVPALADPANEEGCHVLHKACGDGGGIGGNRDETFYDVDIGILNETILGVSTRPWSTFGKGKSIGLGDGPLEGHPGVGKFTDLSFFTSSEGPFGDDGAKCFPLDKKGILEETLIHQGSVAQGRGGRAESRFFFDGFTNVGSVTVLYQLQLIGAFGTGPWPPTKDSSAMLNVTTWELSVANEGQAIKDISCIGEDEKNFTIIVTGPVQVD